MGDIMNHVCDICNYTSTRKYDIERHRKSQKHLDKVKENAKKVKIDKVFKCGTKSVPKTGNSVPHICNSCNREFATKGSLNRHLLKIHQKDKRKFVIKNESKSDLVLQIIDTNQDTTSIIPQKTSIIPQKRQQKNITKSMACEFCNKQSSRIDNLNRHLKICKEKVRIEKEDKDIREYLENKVIELEKDNNKLINTSSEQAKTSNKQAGTIEKMVMTFQDICNSMKDAPYFELDKEQMRSIIYQDNKDDFELIKHLLYQYSYNNFAKYVGDGILKTYLTDDPEDQSIWTTDVSRLSYIIRRIMGKKLVWYNDSKGEIMKHILIERLLDDITEIVNNYLKNIQPPDGPDWEDEHDRQVLAMNFVCELKDNRSYADQINKYIAPHFKATKEKLMLK